MPRKSTLAGPSLSRPNDSDVYIEAMMRDQAKQFLTEGDNRIHVPRLPSPFRRALLPSPNPQTTLVVDSYFALSCMESAQDGSQRPDDAGITGKIRVLFRQLWERLTGSRSVEYRLLHPDSIEDSP
ncbi:MAG: hypothetical protein EOO77_35780 [Oxalobacteraceae bacterium]|nr:MAG: hypothetical protein EOO77_35780 [Oxalobacteraceae bacterium]